MPAFDPRNSLISGRPSLRSLELTGLEQRLERLSRRHRITHVAFMLGQILIRRDLTAASSAMAFDLFLAALPMLALAGWAFGKVLANHDSLLLATASLLNLTPHEVQSLIWQQLDRFAIDSVAPFALLGALWTGSNAFHSSISLLEASAEIAARPWLLKRLIALGSVLGTILLFGSGTLLAVWLAGGPSALLVLLSGAKLAPRVTHYVLLAVLAVMGVGIVALFFYVASPRPGVRRRLFPGAVLTVAAGALVSVGFAFYAGHLARFAIFYGSLAAVAVMLAWLWLLCFVFLIGAELNQLLENGE